MENCDHEREYFNVQLPFKDPWANRTTHQMKGVVRDIVDCSIPLGTVSHHHYLLRNIHDFINFAILALHTQRAVVIQTEEPRRFTLPRDIRAHIEKCLPVFIVPNILCHDDGDSLSESMRPDNTYGKL